MEDRHGILPPEIRAMYEAEEFVDRAAQAGREADQRLKAYDPNLSCVLIRERIPESELPAGAMPGRWHVRKQLAPPHQPIYIPICGPGGTYCDPFFMLEDVIRQLAERDLRRRGVKERLMEAGRVDSRARVHAQELEREQRLDELRLGLRAGKRVAGEGGLRKSFRGKARPPRVLGKAEKAA